VRAGGQDVVTAARPFGGDGLVTATIRRSGWGKLAACFRSRRSAQTVVTRRATAAEPFGQLC